ncbi:hypothetical protein PH242_13675 [Photorhabdus bodei]|uniref:hypothetical protein n=1 Tax=Photorhabdus bodei TaxID=2029681 RepID=UPI00232B7333|nr:hypothetical protein [Photorhabdus bodei]MDB6368696.1 hypothetical protein [Photorhabdus bodei]
MGILTGNDTPIPGKSYIIHPYPAGNYATAVTVASKFHAAPGSVSLAIWENTTPHQKFECVWEGKRGGYLGFICRASPVTEDTQRLYHDMGLHRVVLTSKFST